MSERPDLAKEQDLWARRFQWIAGVDEVGRGAWAGPVVAAAVVLPANHPDLPALLAPVRDSKLLSPACRERCYDLIMAYAVCWGVGSASSVEVDMLGISEATRRAMARAIEGLCPRPEYILIDAVRLPLVPIPQESEPKADVRHLSVASASIIAKVTRDRWMRALAQTCAGYGFERHKGYGTVQHQAALQSLGPAAHHRQSFAPIRALALTPTAVGEVVDEMA